MSEDRTLRVEDICVRDSETDPEYLLALIEGDGDYVAWENGYGNEEDMARLAASWNACRHIPTDALESGQYVVVKVDKVHPSLMSTIAKRLRSDEERHRAALGDHIADAYGMVAEWVEAALARAPQEGVK